MKLLCKLFGHKIRFGWNVYLQQDGTISSDDWNYKPIKIVSKIYSCKRCSYIEERHL